MVLIKDYSAIRAQDKDVMERQMLTLYFTSIAHDLRTPLNAIMASNERLTSLVKKEEKLKDILLI